MRIFKKTLIFGVLSSLSLVPLYSLTKANMELRLFRETRLIVNNHKRISNHSPTLSAWYSWITTPFSWLGKIASIPSSVQLVTILFNLGTITLLALQITLLYQVATIPEVEPLKEDPLDSEELFLIRDRAEAHIECIEQQIDNKCEKQQQEEERAGGEKGQEKEQEIKESNKIDIKKPIKTDEIINNTNSKN